VEITPLPAKHFPKAFATAKGLLQASITHLKASVFCAAAA
jgi:hypothetical protein